WRWARDQKQREEYISILNAFIDKKDSYYSIHQIERLCMPWLDLAGEAEGEGEVNGCLEGACALAEETALWKPLVLLIPLRLGLSDINEAYIETLKLIYLDPHTTQPAVEPCEDGQVPDETYHCQHPPCRMHICELDPSIAAVRRPGEGFMAGRFSIFNNKEILQSVGVNTAFSSASKRSVSYI
ncbi:hypothetical protein XENOCAPTIV_009268, partial [Xenoophorus captivus]